MSVLQTVRENWMVVTTKLIWDKQEFEYFCKDV